MSRNDGERASLAKRARLSRREFLATAALSAGGVSVLDLPILASAASSVAAETGGTGAVAELTGEQALTVGENRYMGGAAELVTAPNGAITNVEALEKLPQIMYLEPTTEQVADGVWSIGGYSVANTTVIEAEDGLIVYDTGDNDEEAEHIRAAIEKISDKPIKVIIYSHSHYALGGGRLVDNPEDVMVIGHPTVNDTVQANLRGGGAPSVYGEIGPVLTARAAVQRCGICSRRSS